MRIVTLLAIVVFFVMMGWTIITPNLPIYARNFGASETMVGALIAGYGIARVIMDMPGGVIAERRPKRVLITGFTIVIVACLISGSAPNYLILFVGRFLEGLGSALHITASLVILSEVTTSSRRGRSLSIYTGALQVGAMVGPGMGGVVADLWGLNAPFFAYAMLMGAGAIVAQVILPETFITPSAENHRHKFSFHDLRILLSDRSRLSVNVATFAIIFTRAGITSTILPLFSHDNLQLSQTILGTVLTTTSAFTLATMITAGSLSDKYGRKPLMILCLISSGIAALMIPSARSINEFWVIMAIYGATLGLSGPIAAWTVDLTPSHLIGTSMGLFRMINDLGFAVGPILLGYLAEVSKAGVIQPLPFQASATVLILCSLGLIKARDPVRHSKPKPLKV